MAKVVAAMRMARTVKGKARGSMFSCFLENVISPPLFLVIQGRRNIRIYRNIGVFLTILHLLNRHLW